MDYFLTFVLLVVVLGLLYAYLTCNFGCWRRRGVTEAQAVPLVGSYRSLLFRKRHVVHDLDDIYRKYKKSEDYVGIFNGRSPQLLITSPEFARKVFVADFKSFHDNEVSKTMGDGSDALLANNPFVLTGDKWKEGRTVFSAALTASKIKAVYPVTIKVCRKMSSYLDGMLRAPPRDGIDVKNLCLRYTSEIVSDCVLGIEINSFSDEPSPIMRMVEKIFDQSFYVFFYQLFIGLLPWIRYLYKIRLLSFGVEKSFFNLVERAVKLRRQEDPELSSRKDILNYLLQLQEKKQLETPYLAGHMMSFLLDGFETTASVIAHCLLMLARHEDKTEKLRTEIKKHTDADGNIEFEVLREMPYLDACIHETLRIFPQALFSNRLCTEPVEFTNRNGDTLKLDRDEVVVVPLASFMNDADFYPDPEKFHPERFLEAFGGLKKYRDMGLYYGFGDGPRTCIGMKFALVQAKAAIVEIVRKFNVRVNPRTRQDNMLDPTYLLGRLHGGIWLDFETCN